MSKVATGLDRLAIDAAASLSIARDITTVSTLLQQSSSTQIIVKVNKQAAYKFYKPLAVPYISVNVRIRPCHGRLVGN